MLKRSTVLFLVLGLFFVSMACGDPSVSDDEKGCGNDCNNVKDRDRKQILSCAESYWKSQVWPRSTSLNAFVVSCFNKDISAAPFAYPTDTIGEDAVVAGWAMVSTNRIDSNGVNVGPFFENNTMATIVSSYFGCEDNKPTAFVLVNRTFYYNETGEVFWTTYFSSFYFVKTSKSDVNSGKQPYTIIYYAYQPYVFPEGRHWPGTPISPDVVHIFYACREIQNRCGNGVDWSPYPSCFEWVRNHPYTDQYPPTFVQDTGYCIFQISFFGISYVPSSDPLINLCPFIPLCTGNFEATGRREVLESLPASVKYSASMMMRVPTNKKETQRGLANI